MEAILGTSWPVFLGITVILVGFAAFMTGQAVANSWDPPWHVVVFCLLLAGASRFLIFGLYEGDLLSFTGYLCDVGVLLAIGLFAYRMTRARRMVAQYPWLYERVGLFGWRERS